MAKRFRRRFRRSYRPMRPRRATKMTIPIAPVVGLAGTLLNQQVIPALMQGNFHQALIDLRYNITGVDGAGAWNPTYMIENWIPTVVGVGVHIAANKFGVNRMLAKAKVPYIRI